jgi:2-polyprenyl-6-methoxyphenol hydroxylase-like FAD-dependent oxidoreductase
LVEALPDQAIEGPLRLRVRVGLARRWHRPGLLVIGDAAHPMSPLRAQGINMALRDALCTARHLLPRLAPGLRHSPDRFRLDQALAGICEARIGEIVAIQAAQDREARRAELLRRQGWLRQLLSLNAHWMGPLIGRHWTVEQRHLREGLPADSRDSMESQRTTS